MVASLLRVLHSGPQDQRLLPKDVKDSVKTFQRVFIRAGRMSTQWERLDFYSAPQLGQRATCRIPVKGELLTRLYLVCTMPDIWTVQAAARAAATASGNDFLGPSFGWTNSLGHALISNATLEIGGARAEVLDGRLLEIMDEFNTPLENVLNTNSMICRAQNGFSSSSFGQSTTPQTVMVPLPFWFSRGDLGCALPIDALWVDEVRVSINFSALTSCYYTESRSAVAVPGTDGSALWPIAGSPFYMSGGSYVYNLDMANNPILAQTIPGQKMPTTFALGETYLMAEYVYLDKAEANRFRIADLSVPIVQHAMLEPVDTHAFKQVQIPIEISNPIRNLFFFCQNYNATTFNAPFLATRDLSGCDIPAYAAPWWPDCVGLSTTSLASLLPGFVRRSSEPLAFIEFLYEGTYVKTSTEDCAIYRSILPSLEMRKAPWHNRYMYVIPFGVQSGYYGPSTPLGETNLNRINNKDLLLGFTPNVGTDIQMTRLWVYSWAETYNVFRIYGGRGTLLFAY